MVISLFENSIWSDFYQACPNLLEVKAKVITRQIRENKKVDESSNLVVHMFAGLQCINASIRFLIVFS